jgi:hypothetical protein
VSAAQAAAHSATLGKLPVGLGEGQHLANTGATPPKDGPSGHLQTHKKKYDLLK